MGVKGIALQELGELEEAAACYEKAIALSPDYVLAHYNLAYVRQDQVCAAADTFNFAGAMPAPTSKSTVM